MYSHFIPKKLLILLQGFLLPVITLGQAGLISKSGTNLIANGAVYIVLNNAGFTDDGIFTPGGSTVLFSGNDVTANTVIAGTATTGFYNIQLNKTANGIQLNHNISVANNIIFTSGDSIFLNNYNIDLGTTGSLSGETAAKRITGLTGGYIQFTADLNAPSAINPGNMGIEITSAANLGNTIIRRGHKQQGNASIFRYFDIIPTTNTSLNTTLNFHYFDEELAGVGEGNLGMFFSKNTGINWRGLGENGLDQTLNILSKNGLDTLNRFTLANISDPLAVSLLYLKAQYVNGQNILNWATVTESDNEHFDIERSADGRNFTTIGTVAGGGNSAVTRYYTSTDKTPLTGINYYRLRMVDASGRPHYSYVVMVNTMNNDLKQMNIFPNPSSGLVQISFNAEKENNYLLQVADMSGRVVQSKIVHCMAGTNQLVCDISQFPSGMYLIKIDHLQVRAVQLLKN